MLYRPEDPKAKSSGDKDVNSGDRRQYSIAEWRLDVIRTQSSAISTTASTASTSTPKAMLLALNFALLRIVQAKKIVTARAFVEQCHSISRITAALVKHLQLPTVHVDGHSVCSIRAGRKMKVELYVRVDNRITITSPEQLLGEAVTRRFMLADPDFQAGFDNSGVECLLKDYPVGQHSPWFCVPAELCVRVADHAVFTGLQFFDLINPKLQIWIAMNAFSYITLINFISNSKKMNFYTVVAYYSLLSVVFFLTLKH